MAVILFIVLYIAACFKWGGWKRWREFYPTILYLIIGDQVANFVLHDYTLWKYNMLANHTLTDILICVTVFPAVVILFLSHYPRGCFKQLLYIFGWAAVNTAFEYIALITGKFVYENGWNIFWSFGVFLLGFALVRLHYRHPLVVWPVSMLLAAAVMVIFRIPLDIIK